MEVDVATRPPTRLNYHIALRVVAEVSERISFSSFDHFKSPVWCVSEDVKATFFGNRLGSLHSQTLSAH